MKKRKTLGLLIHDLDGNYQAFLWRSIRKAVEKLDCNLIMYEGRTLRCRYDADKQHHIMYDFVDKGRVDGLIILTSTISNYIDNDQIIEFCKKYSDIPIISLGVVVPDVTSIVFDNREGMRSLVRHLIKDHGYKKIAFVTGPKTNNDSIERFEAYKEVLEESNIKLDKDLIFEGDFLYHTGYSVMEKIILSEIIYDAVVFANDDMALASIQCLKDYKDIKGYDYMKKCIICGFDDSINSSQVKPALTTVRQPLEEMCHGAVEAILRKIDGERLDDIITHPSVLVKRESCGCSYEDNYHVTLIDLVRVVPSFRAHENVQTYLLGEFFDRITFSLERCHVRSCFISRYVDGSILYNENMVFDKDFFVPDKSELMYAYQDERRAAIDDSIKYFRTTYIVPDLFIPKDRRFTYLVNPLFFGNEHFGFVCFEVVNGDIINFEPIRGQISNSLKVSLMLLEREKMEESILEIERLASLGQLIGGISHNLMTPIMSISGACAGLEDLTDEYEKSIGDTNITLDDHHEIVNEMRLWINRLKEYNSYMSNIITTFKTQAVKLNSHTTSEFTIEEFVKQIRFLMTYNVQIKRSDLNFDIDIEQETTISGDASSLIQVINNIIINAIQSYEDTGSTKPRVDFHIHKEGSKVKFIIRDYGKGIKDDTKKRVFKNMVTTKGKNGTGLSLLLSYSTIKGKFGGEIWFESEENLGTTFYITIPTVKI
ncbi:MAG: ATP-binding protein [Bacillota bacterium]